MNKKIAPLSLPITGDTPTRKMVYQKDVLKSAIDDYLKLDKSLRLCTIEYTGEYADITKIGFTIDDIYEKDNVFYADIQCLQSLNGKYTKNIIETCGKFINLSIGGYQKILNNSVHVLQINYFALNPIPSK